MITMTSGLLVGLAAMIGAGHYLGSEAHMLDAVNIYNEDAAKGRSP